MKMIFDKKDVFYLATTEEAKTYIGKDGYFGNSFGELERDIRRGCTGKLEDIFSGDGVNAVFRPYDSSSSYGLFLPIDKVKTEIKYRPFETLQEFREILNLSFGGSILLRKKCDLDTYITAVFLSYGTKGNKLIFVNLGGFHLYPEELLEQYEYFVEQTEEWQPFGVKE